MIALSFSAGLMMNFQTCFQNGEKGGLQAPAVLSGGAKDRKALPNRAKQHRRSDRLPAVRFDGPGSMNRHHPKRSGFSSRPTRSRDSLVSVGSINPTEPALQMIGSAIGSYVTITQDANSEDFMVKSVRRLLADPTFTAASMARTLQDQSDARANTKCPYPAVIAAVWMACAYSVEAIHRVGRRDYGGALDLLVDAARCAGFAEGACSELVLKFNDTHSSERTRLAKLKKEALSAEKSARLKAVACQACCAGMKKTEAADWIHENDRILHLCIGLSRDEVYRRLCNFFPGAAWKKRAIDR
jgi:hypothetical protein